MAKSSFLGTGWSFPPAFAKREGLRTVSDDDDIRESLLILLSTKPGERVMEPDFGCGIQSQVFEIMTDGAIMAIKDMIARAILFFEPRITLDRIAMNDDDIVDGLLRITLDYTVRTTNSRHNVVYPFYFREGTNVRR
jgi:phage baseplate assembly protein W